jgi:hypothetical protein
MKLNFVCASKDQYQGTSGPDESRPPPATETATLNKTLAIFVNDPTNRFRKYCYIPRLLQSVTIQSYGQFHSVQYYHTDWEDNPLCADWLNINETTGETRMQGDYQYHQRGLRRIVEVKDISSRILGMVVPTGQNIVLDVTKRTISAKIPELRGVGLAFRNMCREMFVRNSFAIHMTISERKTTFNRELQGLSTLRYIEPKTCISTLTSRMPRLWTMFGLMV